MTEIPFEVTLSFPGEKEYDSHAVTVRGSDKNYRIAVLDEEGGTLSYAAGTEGFSLSVVEKLAQHVANALGVDYIGVDQEAR